MKLHEMINHRITERDIDTALYVSEVNLVNQTPISYDELHSLEYGADTYRERVEYEATASFYHAIYREPRELCRDALIMARATASGQALSGMIEAILDSMNCPDPVYMKQP